MVRYNQFGKEIEAFPFYKAKFAPLQIKIFLWKLPKVSGVECGDEKFSPSNSDATNQKSKEGGRTMDLDVALAAVRRMEEIGTYPYFIETTDAELVQTVTALAIPRYWDEELGLKILQEFLGLTSQGANTRLWKVRRLFFVYVRESHEYKYSEETLRFFRTRAKAEFENLETLYKMLAEYYRAKLGQSKDEYEYRNITLRLAEVELQYNVEQGLDTIAEFVGRALFGRRIADLRAACAVLENNIDTLGEWRKHCFETLKDLYKWAQKEWGVR